MLLGDRVFVVRSVTVTGTHLVSTSPVIAAADVPLGTPLSRVDAGAVTRRVEAIRQVASATVTLDWPDHVAIAVTERVPVMAVRMADGGYDLVDPRGSSCARAGRSPPGCRCLSRRCRAPRCAADPGVAAVSAVLAELAPSLARRSAACRSPLPTGPGGGPGDRAGDPSMKGGKTIVVGRPGQRRREEP